MRKLRIALIVSILVNLLLVGGVVGGTIWLRSYHSMISAGSLRVAGSELPAAERRAFRTALRDTRRAMRPTALAARQSRTEAVALLRQPVLDQPALTASLERLRAADFKMRAAIEKRAIAFAATLPPADRARLADAMERRLDHQRARQFRRP